jgi:hypothetical protein
VLPALPSNEKNSSSHHNFHNMGPNLVCNGLLESYLNFPSTKKVSKNQITNRNHGCVPKILNSIYGTHSPLGVKLERFFKVLKMVSSLKGAYSVQLFVHLPSKYDSIYSCYIDGSFIHQENVFDYLTSFTKHF